MNTLHDIIIPFKFRWPVRQIDPNVVEVIIPTGGCTPIVTISPSFCDTHNITDKEHDAAICAAQTAVLTEIAIIKQ